MHMCVCLSVCMHVWMYACKRTHIHTHLHAYIAFLTCTLAFEQLRRGFNKTVCIHTCLHWANMRMPTAYTQLAQHRALMKDIPSKKGFPWQCKANTGALIIRTGFWFMFQYSSLQAGSLGNNLRSYSRFYTFGYTHKDISFLNMQFRYGPGMSND